VKLRFHGAARTVTGSCHILEANGARILLDCGLYQGKRKQSFERNRDFPFDPASIDAVVLSHAHIDHSGNIPTLVARGFRGPIWATSATEDLCDWMLPDSASIQERDVEYVNRKRARRGQRPFEPLYTVEEAERALARFRGIPYETEVEIARGVRLRFEDAGHILGSASCHLRIREGDRERVLVFTGDVGRNDRPILRDPKRPRRADVLICEGTYGDRLHEPTPDVETRLAQVIGETITRHGKVLIPAFSVGRTQRLVHDLHRLTKSNRIPPVPIYVDSPLAANVTEIFRAHPECYDADLKALSRHGDPFGFSRLTYIRDPEASKALNHLDVPCVIIAASGMCEGGRVLHHLKHIAPRRANTILIVGFMAPNTLGRRIADREPVFKVFGDEVRLEAEVETVSGLSAHADRDELLLYLSELERAPSRTFLVHGDEKPLETFAATLRERRFPRVDAPRAGEVFEIAG